MYLSNFESPDATATEQTLSENVAALRPLLFSITYKMTKSVADTEDILQDVFYEYSKVQSKVISPRKYLARSVVNRSLSLIEKKKKVHYPGVDLPEPVIHNKYEFVSDYDISFGLLVLLQKLSPLERAVFVLKESFGYSYEELSEILDISPDYCRQLFHRGRERIHASKTKYPVTNERKEAFATAFIRACTTGNQEDLLRFLKKDITIYSDGGGKALAAPQPIFGIDLCAKFLSTVHRKRRDEGLRLEVTVINGMPGILYYNKESTLDTATLLEEIDGSIQAIYFVRNPDKLAVI